MLALFLLLFLVVGLWPIFLPLIGLLILIAVGIIGYIAWFVWTC